MQKGEIYILSRICQLFSGSSGNSTYIEYNKKGILIDAGKNAKQIEIALKLNDIDPTSIEAIFITHEHSDHVSGLRVFASRYKIKVYASEGTLSMLESKNILNNKFSATKIDEDGIEEAGMLIKPFRTSHDCEESFGYVIETSNGKKLSIATDLGVLSSSIINRLSGSDVVIIESNHDVRMLENGPYPYYLKRRILSKFGHLSNDACASVLPILVKLGTTKFILAHLSKENNMPELAYQTAISELNKNDMNKGEDFELSIATRDAVGGNSIFFWS